MFQRCSTLAFIANLTKPYTHIMHTENNILVGACRFEWFGEKGSLKTNTCQRSHDPYPGLRGVLDKQSPLVWFYLVGKILLVNAW